MEKLDHNQLAALVTQAREGDETAFATLYAATVEGQLYFATSFLKDAFTAQDVIQEVYLSLYRSLHKLENPKLFIAYLNRICYNTCVDYNKKQARQRYELDEETLELQRDSEPAHSPQERYDIVERSEALKVALNSLGDLERAVVLMRYYQDMKVREIAEATSLSESTVKRYIKAAMAKMRVLL